MADRRLRERFAIALIAWQREHGRHGLPWQGTQDVYRVWLSEVMLQQTQVSTVLSYYSRFLDRFPDLQTLARSPLDDVLAMWSGLGYYSRARHLHHCAKVVCESYAGVFPRSSEALAALPGIGRSTAAAIAAFCFGERVSILDGNVRRVLSRLLAFEQDMSRASAQAALWREAHDLLPQNPSPDDMAAYTQGLMDLGATLCTRARPLCSSCPVHTLCASQTGGDPTRFPLKTHKSVRRHEVWNLLVLRRDSDGAVWLTRRPDKGIWAGLWAPPLSVGERWQGAGEGIWRRAQAHAAIVHQLTHRELRLHPWYAKVLHTEPQACGIAGAWYPRADWPGIGMPAPLRRYLEGLLEDE